MAPKISEKTVANERNHAQLNLIANNIGGNTEQLRRRLARLEAELKADVKGRKEFEDYRTTLMLQRADLEARVARNKAWVAQFERSSSDGAFEAQYRRLVGEIETIYAGAKEFHASGIGLLIKDFGYHVAYRRWNDTFSAVPFKPR